MHAAEDCQKVPSNPIRLIFSHNSKQPSMSGYGRASAMTRCATTPGGSFPALRRALPRRLDRVTDLTRRSRRALTVRHSISGRNHDRVPFGAVYDLNGTQ